MRIHKNQQGTTFIVVILVLILLTVGGIAFWRIQTSNNKSALLKQAQLNQQNKQSIEDSLIVYINMEHNYNIKIPKNYIPTSTTSNPRFYYDKDSGRVDTPYMLSLTALPKEGGAPAYTDFETAQTTMREKMYAMDNALEGKGMRGVVTLLKGIQLKGTSYKSGIYATGNSNDDLGRDTVNKLLLVLRDDGSALQVAMFIRPNQLKNAEAEIEAIFNSINLQVQ